jgi:nucleoside-diphosphate-sugar epimerase
MALHVIVGAGPVGTATASLLADRGEQVRVVTRSGGGPEHPLIERVAADATDPERLSSLAEGAVALYNCASPQYHRWLTDWPPLAEAFLVAAERSGAVLTTTSNLYGYGPVTGPITPGTPLAATHPKLRVRADMWRSALAAHEAGRIRATEVRGSDYVEANSIFTAVLTRSLRAGRRASSPMPADVPRSWTSIGDMARTLTTMAVSEQAWGKAWLAPTNTPRTIRQLATRFTEVNGLPPARVSVLPYAILWTAGVFSPTIRELRTTRYQFTDPFVIDSSETERTFDLEPTDLDTVLKNVA